MAPWAIRLISYGLWVMRWLVDSILEWHSLKWKDKEIELRTAICLLCLSREILETETHWFPAALWHPVALETWSGSSLKPHLSPSRQLHLSFYVFCFKIVLLICVLVLVSNKHHLNKIHFLQDNNIKFIIKFSSSIKFIFLPSIGKCISPGYKYKSIKM